MARTSACGARLLVDSVGIRLRSDRTVLEVRGEDRVGWLNGQITNDIRALKPGEAIYALATTVKGKVLADLWVAATKDALLGFLPAMAAQAVIESFDKYLVMEEVELVPRNDLGVICLQGPAAARMIDTLPKHSEHYPCDDLGTGGYYVLCPRESAHPVMRELAQQARGLSGGQVQECDWELARVRLGVPEFGADFDLDNYPQEAGLARALSFSKGCYLGQEVVCMLDSRGRVHRRLARLTLRIDGSGALPAAGEALQDEQGKTAGRLTSVVRDPETGEGLAFGYVKSAAEREGSTLRAGQAQVRVGAVVA